MKHDIITCKQGTWICKCGTTGANRKARIVHEKHIKQEELKDQNVQNQRMKNLLNEIRD